VRSCSEIAADITANSAFQVLGSPVKPVRFLLEPAVSRAVNRNLKWAGKGLSHS